MSFASPWIVALVALFVWWFSTGAILVVVRWADRRTADLRVLLTIASLPVFLVGLWAVVHSLGLNDTLGAYAGFMGAIALWAWIEMAFLLGVITGPNRSPLAEGLAEPRRFVSAARTVIYHEIVLAATLLALVVMSWGAANSVAVWTFGVLFAARLSAKFNLYLGVPRINVEFIPRALGHIPSHFRTARLNWLFPFSILALNFATACWLERAYTSAGLLAAGPVAGFTLLATITALATIEHWFMVVPLPDAKLWRWMLPEAVAAPKITNTIGSEDAHGL
ncbi:putative photosynthetic complex assembly protein PuhE [Roseobacteraceae bacterium S113]